MVLVNRKACSSEKNLRGCKLPDWGKGTTALDKLPLPFTSHVEINKPGKSHYNSILTTWAESFIFAGSSALLLLLSHLFSVYWYFSFFALVPFLYRIIKATPTESLRLGILLGASFFAVSLTDSLPVSPIPALSKLLLGTGLFALFGWTVGWARKHWGFYPSIVAVLWIGIELGVMKLGVSGGLFGKIVTSNPVLQSLITLLGFLTVSVIIVLLNSFLVLVIVKTLELNRIKEKATQEAQNEWWFSIDCNIFSEQTFMMSEERGPPFY
jgi:hypothetical protein